MADIVGSKVITEEELDTITLRAAIEEILGNSEQSLFSNFIFFLLLPRHCLIELVPNDRE